MITMLGKIGILIWLLSLNNIAFAQNTIGADEALKYIGKTVDMIEMVSKVNYNPDSKICMILFPDPASRGKSPEITIIIHNVQGKNHIKQLKALVGSRIDIHARLLFVKNKIIINGNDSGTKWKIFYGSIDPIERPPFVDTVNKIKE